MSKLHLLCELNDEHYTEAQFSFYENFQDAVRNAIEACKEWNEDCEIHAGKGLRITANCGDPFYVTEIKQVYTEHGTHLLVWHHGYEGVDFEVRYQGTYEECQKAMEKEIQKLKDDHGLFDKDIDDNVIDTGNEWEVFDIVKIEKI